MQLHSLAAVEEGAEEKQPIRVPVQASMAAPGDVEMEEFACSKPLV